MHTRLDDQVAVELFNGSFMKIHSMYVNNSGDSASLKGFLFKRLREQSSESEKESKPWFPERPSNRNEVALICEALKADEGAIQDDQYLAQARLCDIKRTGKLVTTNAERLIFCIGEDELVCRWKYVSILQEGHHNLGEWADWTRVPSVERSLVSWPATATSTLATPRHGAQPERGRGPNGQYFPTNRQEITSEGYPPEQRHRTQGGFTGLLTNEELTGYAGSFNSRKYTFGDAYCEAGGMSRAAVLAGLELKWAFDNDEHSIATYKPNFGHDSRLQQRSSPIIDQISDEEFLSKADSESLKVDILHLSPPCPAWSSASSTKGRAETDEAGKRCLEMIGPWSNQE